MLAPLPLDRVTALTLPPGARVVVTGAVTTSLDGSIFLVALQRDGLTPGAAKAGGLFDLAAGGFTLAARSADGATATLTSAGDEAPACTAAGVSSPCFVPRLTALALERLKTTEELAATLRGHVAVEEVVVPDAPWLGPWAAAGVAVAVVLVTSWAVAALLARRARTTAGRIRRAALEALSAVRGDVTLAPVRPVLLAMMARADELEGVRRSCVARLARVDRGALGRRREAVARSTSPDAAEALGWLTAEHAEAARLEADLASSVLGLERIESALRVVALRARAGRGTTSRASKADPVDLAGLELTLRDEALVEVDHALGA